MFKSKKPDTIKQSGFDSKPEGQTQSGKIGVIRTVSAVVVISYVGAMAVDGREEA